MRLYRLFPSFYRCAGEAPDLSTMPALRLRRTLSLKLSGKNKVFEAFCFQSGTCQDRQEMHCWDPCLKNTIKYNTFTIILNSLADSRYALAARGQMWPERPWSPTGPPLISCNWKLSSRLRETLCFGINSLPVQTKPLLTNSALLATNWAAKKKAQELTVFQWFFWLLEMYVVIHGPQWPSKL